MSLINDALKKAQNRHGVSPQPAPGATGPAAIPSAPRKGKTPRGKIVLICAGIALLSAGISTTVILLVVRNDAPAPLPAGKPATPPVQPATPPSTTIAVTASPAGPQPVSSSAAPVTPPAVHTPPPVTPVIPAVVTPPPEPVAPAIKLGTRVQAFIDRLRVTSIRISDTGNKAILNDRLFRINDLVEPSLGLRITDIQPSHLTFTDETGATYLRHF